MLKRWLTISYALLLILVTSASFAMDNSFLYVLHADKAKVTYQKELNQYTLVLHKPHITYFTDRPKRQVGSIAVKNFVNDWAKGKDSFANDNPNAALIAGMDLYKGKKASDEFVVLKNPKLDKNQLSFVLKSMQTKQYLKTGKVNKIVLFIDNGFGQGMMGSY